jgi:hypothetical protein
MTLGDGSNGGGKSFILAELLPGLWAGEWSLLYETGTLMLDADD